MGICASNIGTTTLEPASPQEEGQQNKFIGASPSRVSLKQPVEKQPIAPRTDKHEALSGQDQKHRDSNVDPTQQGQNGSAAKPNDESSKDPSRRTTAASGNQQPNGDFKISFSEQGDKYMNVQKWLNECILNDKTPNPIMPIGGVIVHNMPTPEEMAKIGQVNSSTQVSTTEDNTLAGLKRHKSMMPSTKQYQIS
ncbi:hypothetical protein NAEGRDRAFT_79455 [Naegleria gruberi]|uniref:Uncharacterized protein n=1 Tax=Naegleria gruberi TaxID=5762 RepID=D2VCQ2_NAEGR|nr:uncharacterized protein NAEGRDRAFT_79455 [Naegleria gruberi]EFC45347.1 hypothetical protein NAEGRDRAFT_79455 [Naegleria gruberi]|eukprot:XP_002678091.1 hypothetical protein NAEGRDRAFT_79455 [Naegleria gruberi strain NEG-M]